MPSAAEMIRLLELEPHPEGGHYRQTFRDGRMVDGRAASTAIYFLLARGERSHWHRVDAVEVWHYYAGAPIELEIATSAQGPVERLTLGPVSLPASARRRSCRCTPGRQRAAWANGRWSAAQWRRVSSSRASSWRRRIGRPPTKAFRNWIALGRYFGAALDGLGETPGVGAFGTGFPVASSHSQAFARRERTSETLPRLNAASLGAP
jgi:predicted cupin superfamily sugar epimerase